MSRILLDLQDVGRRTEVSTEMTTNTSPSVRPDTLIFADPVVGSLGTSLSLLTDKDRTLKADFHDLTVVRHEPPADD